MQNAYLMTCVEKLAKGRNTTGDDNSRRTNTYKYWLKNEKSEKVEVCKLFLLFTLGYAKKNDRVLKNLRKSNPQLISHCIDGRKTCKGLPER